VVAGVLLSSLIFVVFAMIKVSTFEAGIVDVGNRLFDISDPSIEFIAKSGMHPKVDVVIAEIDVFPERVALLGYVFPLNFLSDDASMMSAMLANAALNATSMKVTVAEFKNYKNSLPVLVRVQSMDQISFVILFNFCVGLVTIIGLLSFVFGVRLLLKKE
jgi:hypothetical protein